MINYLCCEKRKSCSVSYNRDWWTRGLDCQIRRGMNEMSDWSPENIKSP